MNLACLNLRTAMFVIAVLAVLMGSLMAIALGFRGSNCGGNSAALNYVSKYSLIVQMAAADSPDRQFAIDSATAEQRVLLSELRLPTARLLVSPRPYREERSGPRRVLIVCDTPYRNVPRQFLNIAPLRHAVAYSDGTTGLISVAEFEGLDHASLVPLDELLAASKP